MSSHSLKVRIRGRSLLFTASRTKPACYTHRKNFFARETGHVIYRESSSARSVSISASTADTQRSNTTPHATPRPHSVE